MNSEEPVELAVVAQRAGVRIAVVRRYQEFGLLEAHPEPPESPRYDSYSAARIARAERLRRDLGLNFAGAVRANCSTGSASSKPGNSRCWNCAGRSPRYPRGSASSD